jgi:hypothetical protein
MKTREFPMVILIGMILISQLFTSCLYGIRGNGKTIKSEREARNFHSIKISSGLYLILTQDTLEKVIVETDENLQNIIKTEVSDGVLKIYPKERIFNSSRSKIYVTVKHLAEVEASSGSDVNSTTMLNLQDLKVVASSGADIKLILSCSNLEADNSSGSDILLSGKTGKLIIESSSGSDVNADKMNSETCSVSASSGSDVKVSVSKKIEAHASSGSDIIVNGNPIERDINKSSGGSVTFK